MADTFSIRDSKPFVIFCWSTNYRCLPIPLNYPISNSAPTSMSKIFGPPLPTPLTSYQRPHIVHFYIPNSKDHKRIKTIIRK